MNLKATPEQSSVDADAGVGVTFGRIEASIVAGAGALFACDEVEGPEFSCIMGNRPAPNVPLGIERVVRNSNEGIWRGIFRVEFAGLHHVFSFLVLTNNIQDTAVKGAFRH